MSSDFSKGLDFIRNWEQYANGNYTDELAGAVKGKAPEPVEYDDDNIYVDPESIFGMNVYKAVLTLYGMRKNDGSVSNYINIHSGHEARVVDVLSSIGVDANSVTTGTTAINSRLKLSSSHHNFIKGSSYDHLKMTDESERLLSYVGTINVKRAKSLGIDVNACDKQGQWAVFNDVSGSYENGVSVKEADDMLYGFYKATNSVLTDDSKTILVNMPFVKNIGILAKTGARFSVHANGTTARARVTIPTRSSYSTWSELAEKHEIFSLEHAREGVVAGSVICCGNDSLHAIVNANHVTNKIAGLDGEHGVIRMDIGNKKVAYIGNYDDYEAYVYKGKVVGTKKYINNLLGYSRYVDNAVKEASNSFSIKPNIIGFSQGSANFRASRTMTFYDLSEVADIYEEETKEQPAKATFSGNESDRKKLSLVLGERLASEVVMSELPKAIENDIENIAQYATKIKWECNKGHQWEATIGNRVHGTNCPVCSGLTALAGETDLKTLYPEVASEWDYEKNGELKPDNVRPGSSKKVWWKCNKAGHSWDAVISKRARHGQGCPICSNRRIVAGINDLATVNPELAKQYSKSNKVKATEVSGRSSRSALWECANGHEWKASILKRVNGQQCPECRKQGLLPRAKKNKTFLSTLNPLTVDEWDYENNPDGKDPSNIPAHSRKKYSWIGKDCSHVWEATATSRASGSNCPICAGKVVDDTTSLAVKNPELVGQWHAKNELSVHEVHAGSRSSAWWVCDEGHEWKAEKNSRAKGRGCPVCLGRVIQKGFNDLETLNPKLAAEWDYENNADLLPCDVALNSHTPVWWQCNKDVNHKWQAAPKTRNRNRTGCPICYCGSPGKRTSSGENEMYAEILKIRPDAEQSNRSVLGRQEIDIWIPGLKLGFEYNGVYWHDPNNLKRGEVIRERDARKRARAEELGITLVDIPETAWLQNRDAVMEQIRKEISKTEASVSPGQ